MSGTLSALFVYRTNFTLKKDKVVTLHTTNIVTSDEWAQNSKSRLRREQQQSGGSPHCPCPAGSEHLQGIQR